MTVTTTVTYRCDACSVEAAAVRSFPTGVVRPRSWTYYNGRDFCSYECLVQYAVELAQRNPKRTTA